MRGEQFIEVEDSGVRVLEQCIRDVLHEGRHLHAQVAECALKDGVGFSGFEGEVVLSLVGCEVVGVGEVKGVETDYRVKRVGRIKIDEVVFAALGNRGEECLKNAVFGREQDKANVRVV